MGPSEVFNQFMNIQYDMTTKNLTKDILFEYKDPFQSWAESFELNFKVDQIQ